MYSTFILDMTTSRSFGVLFNLEIKRMGLKTDENIEK